MEKIHELNEGNAFIKNVYFGFENMIPNKSKNKESEKINLSTKKSSINKKKKNKSKEKIKQKKSLEENNPAIKPKNTEEKEKIKNKKKSKKNSKQKKKKENKNEEIKNKEDLDNNIDDDNEEKEDKSKPKKKKKKSKSKEGKKKKKKKSKSKSKEIKSRGQQTMINKVNDDIVNYIEFDAPQYNEIKDYTMNEVNKHIHNLSLTFKNKMVPEKGNNLSRTKINIKKENKKNIDNKIKNIKNDIKNNLNNLLIENDIINKRPYTAHGYKVKSKTKRLPKIIRNNQEEEKIIAFKEKVYVHDKLLSLYNNLNLIEKNEEKNQLSKTQKPKRINSALTKNTFHHYMMPKKKDILKMQKIKKRQVEYYNDKYEDDSEEIKLDEKEQIKIKDKNDKAIALIKSSHKIYGKSQKTISDIKHILNKNNIDTFMNNFLIKHNFTTKKEESKLNYNHKIPTVKYYHGGKKFYRPKSAYLKENKQNNSDNNLLRNKSDKRYKLFNPKEVISNPNNKFNFFNQSFTKETIYGKYYQPPEIEKTINNNLTDIPSSKWNPRYKIKKYIKEEKENPNDVFNYDYKYDDLNSDSDNELPNTDFKARTMPKFNKVKYDYKNYKTGKLIKEKNNEKNKDIMDNEQNYIDKNISHPFLIDDDNVNI